jgi:predicted DNA-binding protein (UPF0251 family)
MPKHQWQRRRGRGPGRPMKPRIIDEEPQIHRIIPLSLKEGKNPENYPINMSYDEFEALRLVDYEGLLQQEASEKMGISRGTLWRCLDSARRKMAMLIVEGRELRIGEAMESSSDTTNKQSE